MLVVAAEQVTQRGHEVLANPFTGFAGVAMADLLHPSSCDLDRMPRIRCHYARSLRDGTDRIRTGPARS